MFSRHRIALLQVSVAVLLDNFINHTLKVEEEEKRQERAEQRSRAEVLRSEGRRKREEAVSASDRHTYRQSDRQSQSYSQTNRWTDRV